MRAAVKEAPIVRAAHCAPGAVVYDGYCYDRRLARCRVYAVADGEGGMEWRVAYGPFDVDGEGSGVERCFANYAEAMRWIE